MIKKLSITGIIISIVLLLLNTIELNESFIHISVIIGLLSEVTIIVMLWQILLISLNQSRLILLLKIIAGIKLMFFIPINYYYAFDIALFALYAQLLFELSKIKKEVKGLFFLRSFCFLSSAFSLAIVGSHFINMPSNILTLVLKFSKNLSILFVLLYFVKTAGTSLRKADSLPANMQGEMSELQEQLKRKLKIATVLLSTTWGIMGIVLSVIWYMLSGLSFEGHHFPFNFSIFGILLPLTIIILVGKEGIKQIKKGNTRISKRICYVYYGLIGICAIICIIILTAL